MSHGNARDAYRFCPRCAGSLEPRLLKPGVPERLVCGTCGFIFYLDPKLAAGTISMLDGGLVLLRRGIEPQLGKWVFPGGFVDRGESVAEAAVRETLEEVNLRVSLTGILDVYSFADHEVVVVAYAAEVVGGSLAPQDECLEARVFAPEAIPWDELAFESTRFALRDYLHRFFPRVRVPRIP
jgi:ADP-ribose pyrophosphatase YjhB (NUDIX family)/ribosomal protein S27AE